MNRHSMKKKLLICFLLILPALRLLHAQEKTLDEIISKPPAPARLVNDFAGVLTPEQREVLEQKLVRFDDSTSSQIAVVIVQTMEGREIVETGTEIIRNWGVGGKKNNNGVVLLVAFGDRKIGISTGYGLEKALPDIVCQQIIDLEMKPYFKGQDYYGGLDRGTDAIMQATRGEFTAPKNYHKKKEGMGIGFIIMFIIILIILSSIKRGGGGSFMSRRGYRGFDGPFFFPTHWGGGGSSGGGGWSGGGGFGGFGGGSGGGGGASGGW